ncbi:MAG: hypothetical protein JNJ60_12085 [Rhodocyclaceae bacterium]|nr:hypothetical protein [Rhodocyclaceae bacterium]
MRADRATTADRAGGASRLAAALSLSALVHAAVLACGGAYLAAAGRYGAHAPAPLSVQFGSATALVREPVALALPNSAPARRGDSPADIARAAQPATHAVPADAPADAPAKHYVRASLLAVAPVAQDRIELPDQLAPDDGKLRRCVLTLFIDAGGRVTEVRVDQSNFAPAAVEAAIAAFSAARFSPGRVHGVAVNSYLQIELGLADPGPATP